MESLDLFQTRYEENYLRRELGVVVNDPIVALTELVANAHDAGASKVNIIVPEEFGQTLEVLDDGIGMTSEHLQTRWMMMRYNRLQHQGPHVAFPEERKNLKRKAFGRNGIGRHGLLCFGDEYTVETWREGSCTKLTIRIGSQENPLEAVSMDSEPREGHGTRLTVPVTQNLWTGERILEAMATRFISMPDFAIYINGKEVKLDDHPGLLSEETVDIAGAKLKITIVDTKLSKKNAKFQGVGIWVGGRRVGDMDWRLGSVSFADARRKFSLRFAVIVQTDDLREEILEDWSGFKPRSDLVNQVAEGLAQYIARKRKELFSSEIEEVKEAALNSYRSELDELPQLARNEVSEFIDTMLEDNPDLDMRVLQLAVKAAINLEKSHLGQSLLSKLISISHDDVDALDQLLEEWTAKDALKALSEIDARLKVIETLRRLSGDKDADELHTIHPLLLKARWIFGPEFESSEYSSNVGLVKTIEQVFGKRVDPEAFNNAKKRPDIVVLKDASVGAQALEDIDEEGLPTVTKVLLIEVKRGGFPIGREEMNQADGYVQDIAYSDFLRSIPYVNAFVVGESVKPKTATDKEIKDSDDQSKRIGRIRAITFSTLIDAADRRLFRLREKLEKYSSMTTSELKQATLPITQ